MRQRALKLLAGSAFATLAVPAMAQDGAGGIAAQTGVADIIVTAQKRAQRLNDVGITIVAADAQQIKSAGVQSVADLPKIAPGLATGSSYGGYPVYSLRGVNFNAAQIAAPPAVSVYIDEAALPYATMTAGLLFDLERVEVLKGPQGTLFGQNSTGGSINVIAAKPTSDLAAGFRAEVNNFGQVVLEGFVSGPLSDTFRARLAATTTQNGAWQRSYFMGNTKNGDQNNGAARLLIDWDASERLKVSINLNANYDHGETQQPQLAVIQPATPGNAAPGLVGYPLPNDARDADYDYFLDNHQRNRQYQAALRLDYEFSDQITFTSLTDYINLKQFRPQDEDGVALSLTSGFLSGRIKTFIQEFRLSGDMDGGFNWVVGANYQKDKIFDRAINVFQQFSSFPPGTVLDQPYNLTNRAVGAFANVEYEFIPSLSFTGGVRYTDTRQTNKGCLTGNAQMAGTLGFLATILSGNPGVAAQYAPGGCLTIDDTGAAPSYAPAYTDIEQKEDNISWRAGLNFKPNSDTLFYGLVSRGYKSGTFPLVAILLQSTMRTMKQEELTAYEAGTKLSLLDRKLQLNLAGFYYDYRDKQFFTYVPVPLIGLASTFANIPKSKVKGFDAEVVTSPIEGFTARGGVTYIKTEVGDFPGFTAKGAAVNFKGNRFNFAPAWTATFDAEYRAPISDGKKAYIGFGGRYSSHTYSDLGESPDTFIPSALVLDARIGAESDKGWRIGAFIRNLTNEYYWNSVAYSGDTLVKFAAMPRTYGLTSSFTF